MLRFRFLLASLVFRSAFSLFISSDLSRVYCFGFVSVVCFLLQFLSGLVLAFVFVVSSVVFHVLSSFSALVSFFWLFRCFHVVGTSVVFLCVYFHAFRSVFFALVVSCSASVFFCGFFVFCFVVVIGFMGYVLPCSQMSYWGLVVFSNLLSVLPVVGFSVVLWF